MKDQTQTIAERPPQVIGQNDRAVGGRKRFQCTTTGGTHATEFALGENLAQVTAWFTQRHSVNADQVSVTELPD